MRETGILLAFTFGLLFALEVLNALYDAFRKGTFEDLHKRGKKSAEPLSGVKLLLLPLILVRWLVLTFMYYTRTVSLMLHEVMHAIAQFLLGGRPRIVLCRNGGYAQSRPWSSFAPFRIVYNLGGSFGAGIMSLAPILGMGAMLYAVLVFVTPIGPNAYEHFAAALLVEPNLQAVGHLGEAWLDILRLGSVVGIAGFVAFGVVVAPSMTPSSTDYYHARYHLLAYAAAVLIAVRVFGEPERATWMMLGAGLVVGLPFGILRTPLGRFGRDLLGGLGLSCAVLAGAALAGLLGDDPVRGLQLGLSGFVVVLVLAAMVYVAFIAVFLVAAVLTFRPSALWHVLKRVPKEVISVFQKFDTCKQCNMHFRHTCDSCGRSAKEIKAAQASG
jgi:hypothetical protein